MFIIIAALIVLLAFFGTMLGVRALLRLLGDNVDGSAEPTPSDPARAQANAEALATGQPEAIRFDMRVRGYDTEQVDAVINTLIEHNRALATQLAKQPH